MKALRSPSVKNLIDLVLHARGEPQGLACTKQVFYQQAIFPTLNMFYVGSLHIHLPQSLLHINQDNTVLSLYGEK